MNELKVGNYVEFDSTAEINKKNYTDSVVYNVVFRIANIKGSYIDLAPHPKLKDNYTWWPKRFKLNKKAEFERQLESLLNENN